MTNVLVESLNSIKKELIDLLCDFDDCVEQYWVTTHIQEELNGTKVLDFKGHENEVRNNVRKSLEKSSLKELINEYDGFYEYVMNFNMHTGDISKGHKYTMEQYEEFGNKYRDVFAPYRGGEEGPAETFQYFKSNNKKIDLSKYLKKNKKME